MNKLLEQLKKENQERSDSISSGNLTSTGKLCYRCEWAAVNRIIKRLERILYPN